MSQPTTVGDRAGVKLSILPARMAAPLGLLALAVILCPPGQASAEDAKAKPRQETIDTKPSVTGASGWHLRCVRSAGAPDGSAKDAPKPVCEASQVVTVKQDGRDVEVLRLAVSSSASRTRKPELVLVALTPLDVLLASGFGLGADKLPAKEFRYRNCNHLGCFAVMPLDGKIISGLRKSGSGSAFFRMINGQVAKVVFSLNGFSAATDPLLSGKGLPEPEDTGVAGAAP